VIEIPPSRLEPALLEAIIETFVLREGTDDGAEEISLDRKIAQVKRQSERGLVVIVCDEDSESCNLLRRDELLQQ
jgi:uncharacterized protein YheU (UPF0270 family)